MIDIKVIFESTNTILRVAPPTKFAYGVIEQHNKDPHDRWRSNRIHFSQEEWQALRDFMEE